MNDTFRRRRPGFTLIEVLVVLVILGALVAALWLLRSEPTIYSGPTAV